jgi:hypothetical protein
VEGDEGAEKLKQLIKAYFNLGGMQVQFNVVSSQALHEAQEKPEEHKDSSCALQASQPILLRSARTPRTTSSCEQSNRSDQTSKERLT